MSRPGGVAGPEERRHAAVLLHGYAFDQETSDFRLEPGIELKRVEGHAVDRLYVQMCKRLWIDDGDPLTFRIFALFSDADMDSGHPYAIIDRLVNVLAILLKRPFGTARVIWSIDNFQTFIATTELYAYSQALEFVLPDDTATITPEVALEVVQAWRTQAEAWEPAQSKSRLCNALAYFYYAWRSYHVEPMCLNLAIVLEVLFAPHSQTETTHQIAFNVARYVGGDTAEQAKTYSLVKRFYGVRSKIVHGDFPKDDALYETLEPMFRFVAEILRTILIRSGEAAIFNSNKRRVELLQGLLFGNRN